MEFGKKQLFHVRAIELPREENEGWNESGAGFGGLKRKVVLLRYREAV
jgi:hypothetical protein